MSKKPNFRQMLKYSLTLDKEDSLLFDKIPQEIFDKIFSNNFNNNINTAERVLFNRYGKLQSIETERLEREKLKITNLDKSTDFLVNALKEDRPVLFLTDTDNDGSLSQSILIEFLKLLPEEKKKLIHIEYAQPLGKNHGFTYEMVEEATNYLNWKEDKDFLIITADNGINNKEEQVKIQEKWKNSKLIITDHHLPAEDIVIEENSNTVIFNPKYKTTSTYLMEKNISGANTLGVYLTESFKKFTDLSKEEYPEEWNVSISNIRELGYWANYLDYAGSDLSDMPVKSYVMERAGQLSPLMNTSNSMSNFVTGVYSEELLTDIEKITDSKITKEWIESMIEEVKSINLFAQKLLSLYKNKQETPTSFYGDYHTYLAEELSKSDLSKIDYKSMNPNYIQQLRPIIYNLSAIDNKDAFDVNLIDSMVNLYHVLKSKEKELIEKIRSIDLLQKESLEFSSILTPIDKKITKVFNRKLLAKAYNEANNGFMLITGHMENNLITGSMRTVYPISEILKGKEEIENKLGVNLYFKGHEVAAGFFIESKNKEKIIDKKTIQEINNWINQRVSQVRESYIDNTPTLLIDFESVDLINKINYAVKSNLSKMEGVPTLIDFSPNENDKLWITDSKNGTQHNLEDIVAKKRYGFLPISTDLKGGAFIAPIELLRTIIDRGYNDSLKLEYLSESVFIGSKIVDKNKIKNLYDLRSGFDKKEELSSYYRETYKDSHFIPLDREYFRNLPYFKYNKYGEQEFNNFENLIITMLEKTGRDVLAVVDTEGTGLGKAPHCFNIGTTNFIIDEKSGESISYEEFNKNLFKTANGYNVLITPEQMNGLVLLDKYDDVSDYDLKTTTIIHKADTENGLSGESYLYAGAYKELNIISNFTILNEEENDENKKVIVNRKLKGFASSYLIKENDFAVTKEFEKLTGVSQGMLNELGSSASFVDKDITEYYANLKNSKNEPAKIIFQAHNMPYDKGVISANFNNFNNFMDTHLISDSAKIARLDKLAYDDTPVSSYNGIPSLSKVYFYDSPFSDYSLTTFLLRTTDKKGGVFPDITAKYLLKYNELTDQFSVIDRTKKDEFILPVTFEDLYNLAENDSGLRVIGELPNNAVKYSVERLSSRAMIRNIILNDNIKSEKLALEEEEMPFINLLNYYQDNYHFDDTIDSNLINFKNSINNENSVIEELFESIDMVDFTERFLLLNKKIQAKFHDGWIYEKVLNQYEPKLTDKVITKNVIEQINYYTDLPDSKIKEVLKDVIKFKKEYKIENAIIHEEHNNIVQNSKDGVGLSDTAYESILPQLLGLMKHYNPYLHSVDIAATEMINKNIKGSMVQFLLKNVNEDNIAKDSFSMKQTLNFNREEKTDLIIKSEKMTSGEHFDSKDSQEEVKFKLSTGVLPPLSGLYAKTNTHIEQEEIYELSKKLEFILLNEQIKSIVYSGSPTYSILSANVDLSLKYREEILSKFDSVIFERREAEFKKVANILVTSVEQGEFSLSSRMKITKSNVEIAKQLSEELIKVLQHINPKTEEVKMLREAVVSMEKQFEEQMIKEKQKAEKAAKKSLRIRKDDNIIELSDEDKEKEKVKQVIPSICNNKFLPELDIARQNPFKFFVENGMELCLPYLSNVLKSNEEKDVISKALKDWSIKPVNKKEI